jgi:hypothetical protein
VKIAGFSRAYLKFPQNRWMRRQASSTSSSFTASRALRRPRNAALVYRGNSSDILRLNRTVEMKNLVKKDAVSA